MKLFTKHFLCLCMGIELHLWKDDQRLSGSLQAIFFGLVDTISYNVHWPNIIWALNNDLDGSNQAFDITSLLCQRNPSNVHCLCLQNSLLITLNSLNHKYRTNVDTLHQVGQDPSYLPWKMLEILAIARSFWENLFTKKHIKI